MGESVEERVLLLTPTGRDAEITCNVLARGGIACEPCLDFGELARQARKGAGAILVADEALAPGWIEPLAAALEQQEPWSDLPILVATTESGSRAAHERIHRHLPGSDSITILARPIPTVTLLTAVRSALSARRRQLQRRDLLAELRAKTERLEEEREIRERFVAVLAHDLRGPLLTATVAADLLAGQQADGERRRDVARRLARSLAQMDRMIRDLLDVHRIQAGRKLPLQLDRCNLGEVARDAADELSATYGDRFVVRGAEPIEGIWSADQLRRALWNLGANAIKYGAPDQPIEIVLGGAEDGACVSVHNQGTPIPPEDQEGLFEAFDRSRDAQAGVERGWGLGLALVRGCAEAHGGTVELESLAGKGTTFKIRLPWDARPFQAPGEAPKRGQEDRPQGL